MDNASPNASRVSKDAESNAWIFKPMGCIVGAAIRCVSPERSAQAVLAARAVVTTKPFVMASAPTPKPMSKTAVDAGQLVQRRSSVLRVNVPASQVKRLARWPVCPMVAQQRSVLRPQPTENTAALVGRSVKRARSARQGVVALLVTANRRFAGVNAFPFKQIRAIVGRVEWPAPQVSDVMRVNVLVPLG